MRALIDVLIPTASAALALVAGHGLAASRRRRAARRELDDYLMWLSVELEEL